MDLLNEREKELNPNIQVERTKFSVWINKWYLISKEFWFIKRLVYKDKINFYKVSQAENELEVDVNVYRSYQEDNYYWLLMILSIQDEPINFLISILK